VMPFLKPISPPVQLYALMNSVRGYVGLQLRHKRRLIAVEPISDLINRPAREVLKGQRPDLVRGEVAGYGMVNHVVLHRLVTRSSRVPRQETRHGLSLRDRLITVGNACQRPAGSPPAESSSSEQAPRPDGPADGGADRTPALILPLRSAHGGPRAGHQR
jgi:hypothetical protein